VTTFRGIQQPFEELEVVHHANVHGFDVHLAHRLDDRRRTLLIRALSRADAVGERHPRQAAVRRGVGQLADRRVVGDRQGAVAQGGVEHLVLTALALGPLGDIQRILVNVVIIVAVFRRVEAVAAQAFEAFEVRQQRVAHLLEGVFLLFKYQLTNRRHGVDVGRQTGEDQSRAVVDHRAAGGNVFAFFHAAFHQQRHQRLRRHVAVHALADDRTDRRQTHDMGDLLFHRRVEFFESAQVAQVAGIQPLIAVEQHHPAAV